ncbi:cyanophycinase [Fulvivirgaceae bacterium BMA10]|uniref:Cyanophycinase n=1 Tax=Splendidivirga corallicola TaxID=3051826 RepID=A0ABT8KVM5_9BACT|nr:cyanophycinase [Fulvivirgaceae bacterium BMA10]
MKHFYLNLIAVLFLFSAVSCSSQNTSIPGEPSTAIHYDSGLEFDGSLVIVGGAMRDSTIFNRFLELAGGSDAPIIVVPTAWTDTVTSEMLDAAKQGYENRGAKNITVLHTKDRNVADSDGFIEPINRAKGVWFTGGRQWRIADSYLGTKTQKAFESLLQRGGVVGGSSAGATIQGSYLARGDTKTNTIMMGDHEEGFGFLKNVAIDQHLLKRNRQFDLIEIVSARPELLGIGIDENTAIVVQGNEFEVIGQSYVAIYDANLWNNPNDTINTGIRNGGKYFLLSSGDRYNLKTREVVYWRGDGRDLPLKN